MQKFSNNMPATLTVSFFHRLRISEYINSRTGKVFNININLDMLMRNTSILKMLTYFIEKNV